MTLATMPAQVALVLNRLFEASEHQSPGAVETAIATAWIADGDAQALFGFVRRLGLSDEQADKAIRSSPAGCRC